MSRSIVLHTALLAAVLAAPLSAQQIVAATPRVPGTTSAGAPARVVRAAPAVAIRVDGRLDEPAWAAATVAAEFTQQSPNSGSPATRRTEARVLVDGEAVYVGMRMYDAHPDSILAQLTRRDQTSTSDGARVFIDSYNDKRTAFVFGLNPRGVKEDFLRYDDGAGIDSGWDAVWEGASHVDSLGWTAEFRIPLSQLRFNAAAANAGGKWGINFRRYVARSGEVDFWAPIDANANAFVSLFGELDGLAGVKQAHRLEVMPYVSSRLDRLPPAERTSFVGAGSFSPSAGADLKAGLPGGLTLSATVNPDFGQVEADPAVVNLSAFETFFPEQRPFFVEGADIFQFGNLNTFNSYGFQQFFYSRRIGRAPQGSVNANGVAEEHVPDASTILGAAKVSGKVAGWSVGVMNALTNRENAEYRTDAGADARYPVEPLTDYFVGRVRRDFDKGATVLGGMLTGVGRDLPGELDPYLRSRAMVGGMDGARSWGNREWTLSGFAAASRVNGSADAIALTQRSSARYFTRPDAGYLAYDTTRTALGGRTLGASLSHSGKWDTSLTYQEVSPGFETNDIGFMNRADYRAFSTFYGRRMNKPLGITRSRSAWVYQNLAWNFGGDRIFDGWGAGANAQFKNMWYVNLGGTFNRAHADDRLTRGGPVMELPSSYGLNLYANTDQRKPVWFDLSLNTTRGRDDSWQNTAGVDLYYRPTTSVQVSLGPSLNRQLDRNQWVQTVSDPAAAATFGSRYVFAAVDRTELSMTTRVDWTFSPTLSLQMYAQPFVSANRFSDYRSLQRPRSYAFTPYAYTASDDFTALSLRGNAVLRWEYRPGSTLFFVWQQDRSGETADGSFHFGGDATSVFDRASRNVFMIKATYWLNR